jgi:hypothetical protein
VRSLTSALSAFLHLNHEKENDAVESNTAKKNKIRGVKINRGSQEVEIHNVSAAPS